MKKRILSALLIAVMLVTLAACGQDTSSDVKDTTDPTPTDTTESLPAGIEKQDYQTTFTILYPLWQLYETSFFADENSGEAMDVALFNRQMKVEEYLGIEIINHSVPTISNIQPAVREAVMSGDDLYQMALTHCITATQAMATEGQVLDLNTIDAINFEADYWNQVSNENLEVAGKQFYAISDYMLPDPNAVLFNKDMVEKLGLENPYDIVREGKWTIDKMMEMMGKATIDNGDGVWDVKDTYGFGCPDNWYITPFIYSAGLTLTEKDEDGLLVMSVNNERFYNFAEKLEALLTSPDSYVYNYAIDNDPTRFSESMNVATGKSLFSLVASSKLDEYRETNVNFGILPYPKLEEEQDTYISLDWSGLLCIPSTVENPEMCGQVIELLSYYTKDEVIPAYYDIVLGEKLSRDEDSKEMLDIIFDGIIFDAGMTYFGFSSGVNLFWDIGNNIYKGGWGGYASFLATNEQVAQSTIDTFNKVIESFD